MSIEARIAGLYVHPLKGGAAIAVEEALLTARGLEHDRRWMVVDAATGRFLSQRELPRLARVRPTLTADELRLDLGGLGTLRLPIADRGTPVEVGIWDDRVAALAVDPAADEAFSAFLGREVLLVRFPESVRRGCDPAHAPTGSHTAFADGFPLLVTGEGSLAELNAALAEAGEPAVPMARFRPNLVLAGAAAGAEDRCRGVLVVDGDGEEVRLDLVKPCDRCAVTTVDQATGARAGKEPLATLARVRRNPRTGGAWFGQNAVPRLRPDARPRLRVGAPCRLVPR